MARSIAFVAWDGPYVTYLEGLFAPIFADLVKKHGYVFHILHFSWGIPNERLDSIRKYCSANNIQYHYREILVRGSGVLGKLIALIQGALFIRQYVTRQNIDIIMPRSTMPAKMVLMAFMSRAKLKVIFDADGLPIEERVDFAGLEVGSLTYRRLKRIERQILRRADAVLTRSSTAACFLSESHRVPLTKFCVVANGRDPLLYASGSASRKAMRHQLQIPADALVLIYCGSVGPQYGFHQMIQLHKRLNDKVSSYLLLLVNNMNFSIEDVNDELRSRIIVRSASVLEMPAYLSTADVGLAIRKNSFSMRGVAPIKIAEYLLMGLPVVASSGVGDATELFADKAFAYLVADYGNVDFSGVAGWIIDVYKNKEIKLLARNFGEERFSIAASAKVYHNVIESTL